MTLSPRRPADTRSISLLLLAAAAVTVGACHKTAPPPSPPPLRIGIYSDVQALDPHLRHEALTLSILGNLYDGLTALDSEARVRPALASSWESPDDLTWRFHLRRGVRFHDGRPLTAADVVFSLNRAKHHPQTQLAHYLIPVREIKALDAETVEIRTREATAILLVKLAMVMIVPHDAPAEIRRPIGTGPFRLVSYVPGQRLELRRFDAYWGGTVPTERVELFVLSNPVKRAQAMTEHRLDMALEIEPEQVATVSQTPGCRIEARTGLTVVLLSGRLDQGPFADERVRRAIDLAVDRDELVRRELLGHGKAANQLVGPAVFGFVQSMPRRTSNLAEARRLLTAAGYPRGIDLDLEFRVGRRSPELERQLGELGVRARARETPWSELYPRLIAGNVSFYSIGYSAVGADASTLFDSWLHRRDTARGYGASNFNHYSDPVLDELIERSSTLFSVTARRELLKQCMEIAMRALAHIPLYAVEDLYGVRDGIEFHPRLDSRLVLLEVSRATTGD